MGSSSRHSSSTPSSSSSCSTSKCSKWARRLRCSKASTVQHLASPCRTRDSLSSSKLSLALQARALANWQVRTSLVEEQWKATREHQASQLGPTRGNSCKAWLECPKMGSLASKTKCSRLSSSSVKLNKRNPCKTSSNSAPSPYPTMPHPSCPQALVATCKARHLRDRPPQCKISTRLC